MRVDSLALALALLTKAYPEARVVPAETGDPRFITIELLDKGPMQLHPRLETALTHMGFKYSDSHGACWYAEL